MSNQHICQSVVDSVCLSIDCFYMVYSKCVGVRKFIYVSVHDYNLPDVFKSIGYFTGKKRAEDEIVKKFSTNGTSQSSCIYKCY
jgi:hypothetical protein